MATTEHPPQHETEQGFGTGLRAQLERRREGDEAAEAQPQTVERVEIVASHVHVGVSPDSAGELEALHAELAAALSRENDLRHELADLQGTVERELAGAKSISQRSSEIDTARCPVFMLTGEYDYSCTPEASRETAALIPGAELTIMPGLGHFPMSEDPERFRAFLMPVLARIG